MAMPVFGTAPSSVNFGDVAVGTTSRKTVTITNSNSYDWTFTSVAVIGSCFKVSGLSLPLTLKPGLSTSFTISFTPSTTGTLTGSIELFRDLTRLVTISLTGTGVTMTLALSPTSLNFGNVAVGRSSTLSVKISNTGTAAVTISSASLSGTVFRLSDLTLPLSLGAGQSTSFRVTFAPAATGAFSGTVSLKSNATDSPSTERLSGTGVTMTLALSPTKLSFGNTVVGHGTVFSVIITNTGTAAVTISNASVSETCFRLGNLSLPLTLNAGHSTSFSVTFAPATTGTFSATASLKSNATDSPTTEGLSGAGVLAYSVSLMWTASTSTGVIGYDVYRGTVSGGPYTKLNASLIPGTSYTDNTVSAGQTYYYVTTAVTLTAQSAYSDQAVAKVPSP
jgi:hypothetical protein